VPGDELPVSSGCLTELNLLERGVRETNHGQAERCEARLFRQREVGGRIRLGRARGDREVAVVAPGTGP
jgi:hypothetical protein